MLGPTSVCSTLATNIRLCVVVMNRPRLDLRRLSARNSFFPDELYDGGHHPRFQKTVEGRTRVPDVDDPPAAVRRRAGAVEDQSGRAVVGRVHPVVDLLVELGGHTGSELDPHSLGHWSSFGRVICASLTGRRLIAKPCTA